MSLFTKWNLHYTGKENKLPFRKYYKSLLNKIHIQSTFFNLFVLYNRPFNDNIFDNFSDWKNLKCNNIYIVPCRMCRIALLYFPWI